ncbi:MAG TPA: SH3 domain-containing protein [Candidatus Kapabacteria bacterium]|nr:SH3 domain-containing protein [Candidatus Kapabacteria bacterium]
MPTREAIGWFKSNFANEIQQAVHRTPFTVDLITAIACQETGYIWNQLRKKVGRDDVLRLCVGDTLDQDRGRRAFPRNRAELEAEPHGPQMFQIARTALLEMAQHIPGYGFAVRNQNKFCHGFGIFQFDLQFFKDFPEYFLEQRYAHFDQALGKAIEVLNGKLRLLRSRGLVANSSVLSDDDLIKVAIAYNTGNYNPSKRLKQGHKSSDGVYYGEAIAKFMQLSKQIGASAPPTPSTRPALIVNVSTTLKVRSTPDTRSNANIVASLNKGQRVTPVGAAMVNGFWEIETTVRGNTIRGFASARYLKEA